jgi:hypothetical protein
MPKTKKEIPPRRGDFYYIEKRPFDRVTGILKIINKPGLITWGIKEAAKAALADPSLTVEDIVAAVYGGRDTAGDIGSMLHHVAEDKVSDRKVDLEKLTASVMPYATALVNYLESTKPKVLFTETTVFNVDHGYAGTLDLIAEDHSGATWILDYKTGNRIYPEHGLQQIAYKNATHLRKEDGTIIPMPKIDRTGIVHLKKDASFSVIEVNEPFEVFLHAYEVWKWARERALL